VAATGKKARQEGWTIIFIDEAGFYLLPGVVKTYAPRGQTPHLRVPLSRDHLAAMGALTWTGEMVIRLQEQSVKGGDVVAFLRQLLQHFRGKLLIIWDGLPAHRSQPVKAFLRHEAAGRLHLERFPAYAPDLNPVEGLWQQVKYVELRNVCCLHLPHLRYVLSRAIRHLQPKTDVLLGCIRHAGLSPAL
jgi:transposase